MIPLRHGVGRIRLQPAAATLRCQDALADLGLHRLGGSDVHLGLDELQPPVHGFGEQPIAHANVAPDRDPPSTCFSMTSPPVSEASG